jgi:RNA polymerase sigma-70 factor (ECF subfamily)
MKRRKSLFAPDEHMSLDELSERAGRTIELADGGERPDAVTLRRELHEEIDAAIRRLPPQYRAVVLLRDVEELTTEETAEILDVSTDVVRTRLHRARLALRDRLAARFDVTHAPGALR